EVLEEGGVIHQETRHWDPAKKHTIVMRVKETADDYRMFPDPDLAPYDLTDEFIESVRAKLPELPDQKAERYERDFGLSAYDARQLVADAFMADFFEAACAAAGDKARDLAKPIANLVLNEISAYVNANDGIDFSTTPFTPERGVQLVELQAADTISSKQAKEVFAAVIDEDKDPSAIVEERGMKQVSDTGAIEAVIDAVIAAHPDEVARYRDGNTKLIGFFVGQCMKQMKGQGNPKMINQLLAQKLG
ncbi:MAG: Asp-tRNA(Asn)/Glu-tRNA(Gln) amidotransferase GatCAB subunit B, partial [Eggerthellaceae bacterium]|nr:Asp-tRNA(Asn)/Glu-tRNA(Gln) amidotransferase GatCAB subunit B [Eggerthellaceae bacterium]